MSKLHRNIGPKRTKSNHRKAVKLARNANQTLDSKVNIYPIPLDDRDHATVPSIDQNITLEPVTNTVATGNLVVNGTAEPGSTLTVYTCSITDPDGPISFTYQWQRSVNNNDWLNIPAAINNSYTIPTDQGLAGEFIRATAVSTDSLGGSTSFESNGKRVTKVDQSATGDLAVNGTAEQGSTLTANTSSIIDPDGPISFTYQWQRSTNINDWVNIPGATNSSYPIPSDQGLAGEFIRATAVSTDSLGGSTSFESTSAQVAKPSQLPGFYLGSLSLIQPTGTSSISSSGSFRDYDPLTNVANYWDVELKKGQSIQIQGTRLEQDYDMLIWLFQGTVSDPATFFAGGGRPGIDQADNGFIDFADDDTENPGPFADPRTRTYRALSDTHLTAIVTNYASGPDDGGDGTFNYAIEVIPIA